VTEGSAGPSIPGEDGEPALPASDTALQAETVTLDQIAARWHAAMSATPIGAEAMRGADRRAQALGVSGGELMRNAGAAVAAVARAILIERERWGSGPILVLAGPGNNGGDGSVAAWFLARSPHATGEPFAAVALVATESRPTTRDASRAWDRLGQLRNVERLHAGSALEVALLGHGIERASLVVDALLGTGVRGPLREPVRSAVELINRAHSEGIPVLAVDTPTSVDLSSGDASEPVVKADVTVTFHRPKLGLLGRRGPALAGRVLVAPIGIPQEADAT
jgi:ADP-dependent NAD(P)H-hydrate dehydratase / NAD(P)H-hydrate epimerase